MHDNFSHLSVEAFKAMIEEQTGLHNDIEEETSKTIEVNGKHLAFIAETMADVSSIPSVRGIYNLKPIKEGHDVGAMFHVGLYEKTNEEAYVWYQSEETTFIVKII